MSLESLYLVYARAMLAAARRRLRNPPMPELAAPPTAGCESESARRRFAALPSQLDPDYPATEAEACARAFFDASIVKDYQLSDSEGRQIPHPTFEQAYGSGAIPETLRLSLFDLLLRRKGCNFPARAILESFNRHLKARKSERVSVRYFIPLNNFASDHNRLQFNEPLDKMSIRSLDHEWLTNFYTNLGSMTNFVQQSPFAAPAFGIFIDHEELAPKSSPPMSIRVTTDVFITALRLLKSGDVSTPGIFHISRHVQPAVGGISPIHDLVDRGVWGARTNFRLERRDTAIFRRLLRTLTQNDFKVWNRLSISLGRFNKSYTRQSAEDRIVDLSICLEACLLTGIQQELQYRLTIRGAAVAAKQQTAEHTRCILQNLYDLRSEIVHEGRHMPDKSVQKRLKKIEMNEREFIKEAENTCRIILRQLVDIMAKKDRNLQEIGEHIDVKIYERLTQRLVSA
jgi:hypothetical protein